MFRIGLVGFGARLGGLRPGADHGGCSSPRAFVQAAFGAVLVPGQPVDHHRRLRRRGARARDRPVGIRHVGDRHHRPAARRLPGPGGELARRVPDQRAARRSSRCGPAARCPRAATAEATRRLRLARRGGDRHRRRRASRSARPAARSRHWQDPHRLGRARRRRRGHVAIPILMLTRPRPARPAVAVLVAQLHGRQPVDVPDLRRAVRVLRVPALFLQGTLGYSPLARRRGGHPGRDPAHLPLDAGRPARPPASARASS